MLVALALDRAAAPPLSSQVAGQIREGVLAGTAPGRCAAARAPVPWRRDLEVSQGGDRAGLRPAGRRGLARGTARVRHVRLRRGDGPAATPSRRGLAPAKTRVCVRLDTGTPWIDPRHRAAWRQRLARRLRGRPLPRRTTIPRGCATLRVELATHLARTRGPALRPRRDPGDRPARSAGLNQVLAALPPGDRWLTRTPGYRAAAEAIRAPRAGRSATSPPPSPITDLTGTVAAYVTPAHQHPLGPVMPGSARLSLIEAAARAGAVVIEDDYDSEFRYDVAPVPALAALDRDRVAYLGTTSKTVAPSMRLGWLVAPPALHRAILARRTVTHDVAAWPVQRAFLSLLRDGYVDQVVRSARRTYAARAARVTDALRPHAEPILPVAGMYATVPLPHARALRAHASARGSGVRRTAAR